MTNQKNCENSVKLNIPNASISHLSLPKDVETGLGVTSKKTAKPELTPLLIQPPERKTESDLNTLLIKEEPPDSCQVTTRPQATELGVVPAAYSPSQLEADHGTRGEEERPKEKRLDHGKSTNSVQQVSISLTPIDSHDTTAVLKNILSIQEHEETHCLNLETTSLPFLKEPMMRLFLGQNANLVSGTKEAVTKGETAKLDRSRGVIISYLFKEEPPDVPSYAKPLAYPGKTLNSQGRMKANLFSFGIGQTVLRAKPLEGGGDDTTLDPAKHGTSNAKTRLIIPSGLRTRSIEPGGKEPRGDVFLGAYRPNLKELSHESNCSRNSTHQGITERKKRFKIFLQDEVIQLSSWQTANDLEGDQRLPTEGFQSNQDEPRRKTTCFGNSTHQRFKTNWIHANITYGLKVIQLLNQEMLDLPCLGAHEFKWPLRLPLLIMHDLEVFHTSQKVPRHHLYLPKLSRYKGHSKSC